MSCIVVGAAVMTLAAPEFTLGWQHSVEHVEWQEDWRVTGARLHLETARVRGSGAGMEPGPGARLVNGWWEWPGDLSVPSLALAASGATAGGWTLCTGGAVDGTCTELAATRGAPVTIRPCGVSDLE